MKVYTGVTVLSLLAFAPTAKYIAHQSAVSLEDRDIASVAETGQNDPAMVATVVQHERNAFDAVKKKDKKAYGDLMADEMTVISAEEGILDKAAALKSFDSETLSSYSLNDVKATTVTPDVIMLVYKLHIKTALSGKPHEGDFLVSSVWVNRGGVWKNILYQETPPK